MARVPKKKQIIDRKALVGELEDLVGWSGYTSKTQGQVLAIFKTYLKTGFDEVRRRFEEENISGDEAVRSNSFLIDQLVLSIHDFAIQHVYPMANPTTGEQISVAATGGYGRQEMAPHSDIDLLFLLPYKKTAHSEQIIEFMLYMLWDLGLKVGHATRSVDESIRLARQDLTICTSLLECRWLMGGEQLYRDFKLRFAEEVVAKDQLGFTDAKLEERDKRHASMGDTRYVLEPNIKEGKGGLRDLQTLFWIAKFIYKVDDVSQLVDLGVLTTADAKLFAKAQNFLWTVRCHLHYLVGRPEERLSFDVQNELAGRMSYTDRAGMKGVERFMKYYFLIAKDVGDLTRILCAVLEDQQKKRGFKLPSLSFSRMKIDGFQVDSGRLNVEGAEDFKSDPIKFIRLFYEAQKHDLDIHPQALRWVKQSLKCIDKLLRNDPEANRLFVEILTSQKDPQITLMRMNEAGVLGRFIPDFGRVVAQMQYDMYHVYTVDEHTIRAIGTLYSIEQGKLQIEHPLTSGVIREIQSRRVLYLAVLLHDIAKGRGGSHSEIGAEIALKLCPRMGLNEWETETVSWLVLNHLRMTNTAFKRDLEDPKTISDFADAIQSPERLRLLLVLSVADVRAVGPNVWNAWKAGLLRDLYYRTLEVLTGGAPAEQRASRVARAKERLRDSLSGWTEPEIEAHLARGYDNYWLTFPADSHIHHAELIRQAETKGLNLHIETRVLADSAVTELVIYTADDPGLFSRIAGAIALAGAPIVDAKIMTMSNGMALDTFWIQDVQGGAFESPERLKKLHNRIEEALSGQINIAQELELLRDHAPPKRTRVFKVPPHVLVDNKLSRTHTVIELNGRNRVGLLHDVTAAITALGLQIASAHISTYGVRVVDVFYVKDIFGLKVENKEKHEAIRKSLLVVLSPPIASSGSDAEQNAAAAE
ncbi:MAG: [protein-PII] uridylyltransferase [Rhodospirillaceae bacterium]|jgi:[protein-PII] uridylyltransferase|nr:[protein-PII] uridylyltransferase [Rhodospirillales bacterium]MBT3904753.1 [protein-PII] uridylyltransferase [Rhodospirillaceae bacterium]MBT4700042.1 [protein-PII] uridylyltransferase [Rhodospirillaceae bacterium]MBT5035225.1 [protein-PII] uridylyltransferase [Rhodospirillaceae bacterium]MBT6220679.1 [protein-PII] uridylyltransferase [Rhodospirillaceae bacterium]